MLRAFKAIWRHTDDHAQCRRRRCIPSLPERASCLEDRVLLSAAGGKAHTAEVAQNPANTKAGKEVTNLFESILQTNPTGAQLTRLVHEMRGGLSIKALRKDLTAQARAQQGAAAQAPMNVVVNGNPSAAATASMQSAAGGTMNPASIMQGLSAPTDSIVSPIRVSQMPAGMQISRSFAPSSAPGMVSISLPGGTSTGSMSATMSPTSTMTGTSSATGMSMSAAGSMSSPPATSAGMGTPGMVMSSPMTWAM
jgi:hypothetical protein